MVQCIMEQQHFTSPPAGRLDQALASLLEAPRNQIESLIEQGCITVDNRPITKKSHKLTGEETLTVTFPVMVPKTAQAISFDVPILYQDESVLVVNKPDNLVVHDAPSVKEPTLVDWLITQGISLSTLGGEERHGIVHRIDKDTTGALCVAKTNEAHTILSEQLADKSMGRYYITIITPPLKNDTIVDAPLGRSIHNRLKVSVLNSGKEAKSAFVKLATSHDGLYEVIAVKLFTGRTHQIRAHLASLGRAILGDTLYGFKSNRVKIQRPYLHAYLLYFRHPEDDRLMQVVAPMYDDMKQFLEHHFGLKETDALFEPDRIVDCFHSRGLQS